MPASAAAKAKRWSRSRGSGTMSSLGAPDSSPIMTASGALASPARASGMNTSGRSLMCT
jgi:hypothetical protein